MTSSVATLRLSKGALRATATDPQLAGYPELPWVSNQSLPARGWWDQQERRNFGDPVHEYDEVLSMWGPDYSASSGFVAFGLLCKYALVPERPTVPREYPYSGLVRELGGLEENKAREYTEDGDE
ncbi:Ndufb8, NADH dehydrogenase 19kDa subunit [Pisolithus sp. B1]|nr:Ndufb8, NADH dehydrogenase 19kDa subunit [Pisolithus sp. B1]